MIYPQRNKLKTFSPGPLMQAALSPALRRVRRQSFVTWLGRGLLAGLLLAVLFLCLARVWPWYGVSAWCLLAGGVCLLLAMMMAWLNRPGWYSAAVWLDEAGLQERAVTALENIAIDTAINRRQRQDTLRQIKSFHPQAQPYPWPVKHLAILGGAAALVLVLALLPNPRQMEADRQQAVRREAVKQSHQVAAVRKKMEQANKTYPLAEREKTIKTMRELEKQLARARNLNQGLKTLARSEDRLLKLQASSKSAADAKQLAAALKKQELTRALGEKIEAGDIKGSLQETQRVLKKAAAMTKQQREAAAAELAQQGENMSPAAGSLMKSLAGAISKGQGAAGLASLSNQIASTTQQAAAAATINQGLATAGDARQGLLAAADSSSSSQLASGGSSGNVQGLDISRASPQTELLSAAASKYQASVANPWFMVAAAAACGWYWQSDYNEANPAAPCPC